MKTPFAGLAQIPRVLLHPDHAFSLDKTYRSSIFLLWLLLFLLFLVGERLVYGYYQNPYTRVLAVMQADESVGRLMAAAPQEAREQVRDRMVEGLAGSGNRYVGAAGIVFAAMLFTGLIFEVWVGLTILSQFFGGQEERRAGRRPSLHLVLYGCLPLAVRKAFEGLVMLLRDPGAASNALTLEAFRDSSRVTFSLAAFLPSGGSLLYNVVSFYTDPFLLWTFFILVLGCREVYGVRLKGAFWMTAVCLLVLGAQNHLLKSAGLQWGVLL